MKWISVDDSLPEREGLLDDEVEYCLVALKDGTVTVCGYEIDGWSEWDNYGPYDEDYGVRHLNTEDITHWMPEKVYAARNIDDVQLEVFKASERLPEPGQRVIIYYKLEFYPYDYTHYACRVDEGGEINKYDTFGYIPGCEKYEYWAAFPKPPKEVQA